LLDIQEALMTSLVTLAATAGVSDGPAVAGPGNA
jgi:hypothetical protein